MEDTNDANDGGGDLPPTPKRPRTEQLVPLISDPTRRRIVQADLRGRDGTMLLLGDTFLAVRAYGSVRKLV
jgi:hypothetical protein